LSDTFEGDLSSILNPTIASAEIIRRTLWGLLRLELEATKVSQDNPKFKAAWVDQSSDDGHIELKTMSVESMQPLKPTPSASGMWISNDMSMLSDLQILGELCLWATAFASIGIIAAAHRVTL
jgi:hypothetical protein